jgi:hypothetical protein
MLNIQFWKKQDRGKKTQNFSCLNGLGRKPGLDIFVELRIPLNDGDETARKKNSVVGQRDNDHPFDVSIYDVRL